MTNPDDPAFINPVKLDSKLDFCGLTKREYFATMAMQGRLANTRPFSKNETAYSLAIYDADSLIAALNETEGE